MSIGLSFKTATWEAISAEVIILVRSPELRKALAYHFSQVASWARVNDVYMDFNVGALCTYSSAPNMKPVLHKHLIDNADEIVVPAEHTLATIDDTVRSFGLPLAD